MEPAESRPISPVYTKPCKFWSVSVRVFTRCRRSLQTLGSKTRPESKWTNFSAIPNSFGTVSKRTKIADQNRFNCVAKELVIMQYGQITGNTAYSVIILNSESKIEFHLTFRKENFIKLTAIYTSLIIA